DTLHLQRLDRIGREFRVFRQFQTDLFDQLAGKFNIRVVGDPDCHLFDHPIAAHVLNSAKLAERYGEDRTASMTQAYGTQSEGYHRSSVRSSLDILSDA